MNDRLDVNVPVRSLDRANDPVASSQTRDPAIMETVMGREYVAEPNRQSAETEQRNARFYSVSKAFPQLDRAWQLHVTDTAIILTVQTLALHVRRGECEKFFFASVDQAYAAAASEDPTQSDGELQRIYFAAQSVKAPLQNRIMADYVESVRSLSRRELIETRPFPYFLRTVAETLDRLRTDFLQTAAGTDLHRLLARCRAACTLLNMWELGERDDNETAIPVTALYTDAVTVINAIETWLKQSRSVVRDGKIKNTSCR